MSGSHLKTTHYPIAYAMNMTKVYGLVHAIGTRIGYENTNAAQPRFYAYFPKKPDMKFAVAISHIHNINISDNILLCGCLSHTKPPLDCCEDAADKAFEY